MKGGWRHTVRQTQANADGEVNNNKNNNCRNVKSDDFWKKQPSLATVDDAYPLDIFSSEQVFYMSEANMPMSIILILFYLSR